jgi:hypothetical protein
VHVVQAEHDRPRAGEALEQRPHCALDDVTLRGRAGREAGDHGPEPRCLGSGEAAHALRVERVQGVDPEAVGRRALELRRAPGEHEMTLLDGQRAEPLEQARLADPRLARQPEERAGAVRERAERSRQRRKLALPSDELGSRRHRRRAYAHGSGMSLMIARRRVATVPPCRS